MRKIVALILAIMPLTIVAQVTPSIPNNTILGNSSGSTAAPSALTNLPSGVKSSASNTLVDISASQALSNKDLSSPTNIVPPAAITVPG